MKYKFIIITMITALLLTGCNGSNNSDPEITTSIPDPQPIVRETEPAIVTKPVSSTEKPVITKPAETDEKKSPSFPEANDKSSPLYTTGKGSSVSGSPDDYVKGVRIPENIYGPDLNKIIKADITDIKESGSTSGQRIWNTYCDGFAYLAIPSGLCFGSANGSQSDGLEETAYLEFKRLNVGDEIMGFTVKEAEAYFTNMNINDKRTEKTRFYTGGSVTLEGNITMEGYIRIASDDEPMFMYENEIFFLPSPENALLPVLDVPDTVSGTGVSEIRHQTFEENSFDYICEYPAIILGSAKSGDLNLSDAPKGEYIKAFVTLDGVTMKDSNMASYILTENAEIVLQ